MDLTENQRWVLAELRRQGCDWIAAATEREWKAGKPYYIDARVPVRGIRRRFAQGNREATQGKE